MNFIINKHNRPKHKVNLPNGLRELMTDISREVLREQPQKIPKYIADHLDALLVVRENEYLAKHTVDDLVQFNMDMSDLMQLCGMSEDQGKMAANYLYTELNKLMEAGCIKKVNEKLIVTELISKFGLDRKKARAIKKIIKDSFKGYFYRYISYRDVNHRIFGATWAECIKRTLDMYSKCKPEHCIMYRAATTIQATFRGYYQRKKLREQIKQNEAALVIQKYFRGYETRRLLSDTFTYHLLNRSIGMITWTGRQSRGFTPPYPSLADSDEI